MRAKKVERGEALQKGSLSFAVVIAAVVIFTTVTAEACPSGYVPCGERKQLCCPQR
jgi:hypothetical protein